MKNIKLFISATIVSIILFPLGIVWNVGKSLLSKGIFNFINYWLQVLIQILYAITDLLTNIIKRNFFYNLAIFQDLLWNVLAGELLEDIITWKENTPFGRGKITVSASTGYLELNGFLNKTGIWFSNLLNKFFNEKQHCLDAWQNKKQHYILKK